MPFGSRSGWVGTRQRRLVRGGNRVGDSWALVGIRLNSWPSKLAKGRTDPLEIGVHFTLGETGPFEKLVCGVGGPLPLSLRTAGAKDSR